MSAASPLTNTAPSAPDDADDAAPASEPSRPTSPWRHPAPVRDALSTLNEDDFDFHDTIPAPPWLDELDEAGEAPLPAR